MLQRGRVPDVLDVSARQVGYPVELVILVKADDRSLRGRVVERAHSGAPSLRPEGQVQHQAVRADLRRQ